jgi:putative FmdB family regulatory protein
MPIFEYRCRECHTVFEKIQRNPADQEFCPECGGIARRAVSAPVAGVSPASGAASPSVGCGRGGFS